MIADSDPVFVVDKYTEFGKWMDGWETRRKRVTGHDWCILKLATKCVIRGKNYIKSFNTSIEYFIIYFCTIMANFFFQGY